jgi:hypothetical protein
MTLWDELLRNYDQKLEDIKTSLAYGAASEYSEYRQLVGQAVAVTWCRDMLKETVRKRIYEEDQE